MSFLVSEWKSAADCLRILNDQVPNDVFGGRVTVAAHIFGAVEPLTGVMLRSELGSGDWGSRTKLVGSHESAKTVMLVTVIVFPRVQAGNFTGKILSVSN